MIVIRWAIMAGFVAILLAISPSEVMAKKRKPPPTTLAFVVDTIVVEGNHVTKPFVITREMTIKAGDTVTGEQLEKDQKRIQNLGLFTRVEIIPRSLSGRNELVVQVTEEWYIFPMPFWRKEGNDFSRITYGFQFTLKNFRGRDERISARAWAGEQTGYQLSYSNPWFAGKGLWGCAFEAFRTKIGIQNDKYRELSAELKTSGGRASVQRRFGLDTRLNLGLGFSQFSADYPELLAGNEGHDDWISINLVLNYDGRDLFEYPSKGWYSLVNLSWNTLLNRPTSTSQIDMISGTLELRHYRQLPSRFIMCERGTIALSGGQIPLYRRFFLGPDRIRGWGGDVEEGEGLFIGSLELRRPIYDIHYFTWKGAPILKRYVKNLKYGLSAGLFLDVGQVWIDPGGASWRRFQAGYGIGLHFHVPYSDIMRLEAGWPPDSHFRDARITISTRVAF